MTVKSSFSSLLIETAKAGFPSPYRAERLLLQNFVGQQNPASAATGVEGESREARKDGSKWGRDREVRAGLIRMLCTSRVAQAFADPHGINVDGAKITGALDLARISIPFPIILQNCYFDATPRFSEANVPELNLEKSFAPGLDAELITVKGHLSLQNFTSEKGEINLRLCHLTGNLT